MKKIRFITRFLLIITLLVHAGCMSTDSNARGGLKGVVTDVAGTPLSGVTISTVEASTVSDANGEWLLTGLPVQTTEVTASRENFQSQKVTVEVISGETITAVLFSLASDGDIYDIRVVETTSTRARVVFSTKMATRAHIRYGINATLDQTTAADSELLFTHQFELMGLTPGNTYRFKCLAVDAAGRNLESDIKSFNTTFALRPEAPTNLIISKVANSNMVNLVWNSATNSDFAGYRVYRSRSLQGPFDLLGSVNLNSYSDGSATPGVKYYYRVSTLAGSGDESTPSQLETFLMPGVMSENAVWTVNESPYQLTGTLTVPPGISLMIDKGVAVKVSKGEQWENSAEDGLVRIDVQGTMVIQGTDDSPVTITSAAELPAAGDWYGLIFSTSADLSASSIKGLKLSFAKSGIYGLSGIPAISHSSISNCSEAAVRSSDARSEIMLSNLAVDSCTTGFLIRDNNVAVKILDSTLIRCVYGIVCRDNKNAQIQGNRISLSGVTGLDVGNSESTSIVSRNLVGYGSNGTGIVCRGNDEIRRNTLHANIAIEIKDTAKAVIRSNLLLADKDRNALGVKYTGALPYNPTTSPNLLTIQNNAVWNLTVVEKKYANSDGNPLPASADLAISPVTGPALQGGDPFLEFPSLSYSYVPSSDSPLKGAGYDFETIGAEDVPD